jgi:prepilin-type N-terminal cleavage/methylation domain-containing protein
MALVNGPTRCRRGGFTLIEMLVVISIIIVVASLALLLGPSLSQDQRTTRGADHLSMWLLIAKQRSFRDQQPRGVRLIADPNSSGPSGAGTWVRELVYIERPADLQFGVTQYPGTIVVPSPRLDDPKNPNPTTNAYVFVPARDFQSGDVVLAGDFLIFDTLEDVPANAHRIATVTYLAPGDPRLPPPYQATGGTDFFLAAADGTASLVGRGLTQMKVKPDGTTPYRFVRQPRPMAGEPRLQLPRDVIVDLDPTTEGGSVLPAGSADILFSPRGQLMADNASGGMVVLRVRNADKPFNPALSDTTSTPQHLVYDQGDQILIAIYTRSGLIAAHPVDMTPNPTYPLPAGSGKLADPFSFVRDGKSSGM